MSNNFETMTVKDLRILHQRITAKIEEKQAAAKRDLLGEFAKLAADNGLSLTDVLGAQAKGKVKVRIGKRGTFKGTPKRDAKTGVLWSGRGRMPKNFDKSRAIVVG